MHRNNFVPVIVERGARRAAHLFCRDRISLSDEKKRAHRAYRHRMNIEMHKLTEGFVEPDEFDDSAPYSCRLTGYHVW